MYVDRGVCTPTGEKADKKKETHNQRGEDQLAHLNISDTAPLSPAPPGGDAQPGMLSRENSVASVSGTANVPPDTQKFLNFAGLSLLHWFRRSLPFMSFILTLTMSKPLKNPQITLCIF